MSITEVTGANNDENKTLFAGIEAGGTKFNCVLGYSPINIVARKTVPTTTPEETFTQIRSFFEEQENRLGPIRSMGIASFGPLDLHKKSPTYGSITATPKPTWNHVNVLKILKDFRNIPMGFDTDVNGAALGEWHYGVAQGLQNFVYVTIGTGIGAGVYANGQPVNGSMHLEVGHMLVPIAPEHRSSKSVCPFHDNCLSAVASGIAIENLWKTSAKDLPVEHPAWDVEAHYLAVMCTNLYMLYCPERIILGGGVMQQNQLFSKTRVEFMRLLAGYMFPKMSTEDLIVAPGRPSESGEIGAMILAEQAWKHDKNHTS